MAFDPEHFSTYAENVFAEAGFDNELLFRVAIGRWYYAIFHQACRKSSIDPNSTSVHRRVSDYFKEHGHPTIGNQLGSLHVLRCNADYDVKPSDEIGHREAKSARRYAGVLSEALAKYSRAQPS